MHCFRCDSRDICAPVLNRVRTFHLPKAESISLEPDRLLFINPLRQICGFFQHQIVYGVCLQLVHILRNIVTIITVSYTFFANTHMSMVTSFFFNLSVIIGTLVIGTFAVHLCDRFYISV